MSQCLQRLQILDIPDTVPRSCWRLILSQCSRSLQELEFTNLHLKGAATTAQLLSVAQTLKRLVLEDCLINWSEFKAAAYPRFPTLEYLTIRNIFDTTAQELQWIEHCTGLQTLNWHCSRETDDHMSKMMGFKNLKPRQWPHLEHLSFGTGGTDLSDSQVAVLLDACSATLKAFCAGQAKIWYRSLMH